ncbi:Aminodeoxychorismate synthase component 1 [subsurface metagenome]
MGHSRVAVEEIDNIAGSKLLEAIAPLPYSFFLDSGSGIYRGDLGRYSLAGWNPFLILKSRGSSIQLIQKGRVVKRRGNPFFILRDILDKCRVGSTPEDFPPFVGGGVGYLSYDLCHFWENLPSKAKDDLDLPELYIAFYDKVLIIDHLEKRTLIAAVSFFSKRDNPTIKERIEEIRRLEQKNDAVQGEKGAVKPGKFLLESNFTKQEYLQAVRKAKNYIREGDIFQVNLSQRFHSRLFVSPYRLYQSLREINPAPFAAYLNFNEIKILSSSPERFLRVRGRKIQTRPIKGTRPRGRNEEEDKKLGKELLASEKDRAELLMIVDLERNDLGRVCQYGSVKVEELVKLEVYPTVFHTASTIRGTLAPGKDRIDLLRATFPGGSITGAPKVRAMEIIDELEPTKRSVYTGSLGYFGFNESMDLNIVIRTFLAKNDDLYFQVGGGIVADSDPEKEFQETLDKAKALISSLCNQQKI